MPKKLTTEIFVERATKIHNGEYDYSLAEYINNNTELKIICKEHGVFNQKPLVHFKGSGCPKCGDKRSAISKILTYDNFVEKANIIHNNKYLYNKDTYIQCINKTIITCPVHGNFSQLPNSHLQGSGCPLCALECFGTGFVRRSWLKHHKNKCNEEVCYYVLRLYNDNESFIKIGITGNISDRLRRIPYSSEIIYLKYGPLDVVYDEESRLHNIYKTFKYKPQIKFAGHTECFNLNIYK